MLYSFINQSIENYHILFIFLDIENLSDDNFQELYDNYTRSLNTKENVYYKSISRNMLYIFKLKQMIKKQESMNLNEQFCQNLNSWK